jgi:hypothetical protein
MGTRTAPKEDSKEVASVSTESSIPAYLPGTDWDAEVSRADAVAGHDLAKDDLLDALVGVPFMITRLTFRKGMKRKDGVQAAYASCETVIGSDQALRRRRVNMQDLPFEPGGQVIFNDGSTGIYRQVVEYLAAKGMISLPEGATKGAYGESIFDTPPIGWTEVHDGELTFDDDGWADYAVNIRLVCPRGLRVSEYENEYNPNGSKTRYLA